jgi:hypothetical protein
MNDSQQSDGSDSEVEQQDQEVMDIDLEENSAEFVNRMVEGQIRDSSEKAYTSSINVIKRAIRRLYPQNIDDNNEIINIGRFLNY